MSAEMRNMIMTVSYYAFYGALIGLGMLLIALMFMYPLKKWNLIKSYYTMNVFLSLAFFNFIGLLFNGDTAWGKIIEPYVFTILSVGFWLLVLFVLFIYFIYPISHGIHKEYKRGCIKYKNNANNLAEVKDNLPYKTVMFYKHSPYIENIKKNIWLVGFLVSVLCMIYWPPYHIVSQNYGEKFTGYGTFSLPPAGYSRSKIDTTRLGMQIIVSAAICGAGYKITKK